MAQGTCDGTSVLGKHDRPSGDPAARPSGDQPRRHQGAERGPTDPQPPRRPVALRRPQRGVAQPHGYYCIPEAWGHTSSDASGGGPCKHATSVALAADLTRTWAVAISGTVPDGEGVAASLPLQYGAHRPWVHTADAEVILHLLRHADRERTTGVPAGPAKVVNQMPLRWLRDGLCAQGQHAGHPFWYVRATSHHSDAVLHKAPW